MLAQFEYCVDANSFLTSREKVVEEDVDVTMTMSRPKRKPVQKDYEEQVKEGNP